jgi:hypothetical protein
MILATDPCFAFYLSQGVKDAPYVFGGKVVADQKYYYSQNGVTWLDLAPLNDETYTRASTISGMLSGQPGKKYRVEEPAPVAEGEAPTPEAEVRRVATGSGFSDGFTFIWCCVRCDALADTHVCVCACVCVCVCVCTGRGGRGAHRPRAAQVRDHRDAATALHDAEHLGGHRRGASAAGIQQHF